jgi:hypothetical protein
MYAAYMGHVGAWARGSLGTWEPGHVGAWARGSPKHRVYAGWIIALLDADLGSSVPEMVEMRIFTTANCCLSLHKH